MEWCDERLCPVTKHKSVVKVTVQSAPSAEGCNQVTLWKVLHLNLFEALCHDASTSMFLTFARTRFACDAQKVARIAACAQMLSTTTLT